MALGEIKLFQMKSKEQTEREDKEYAIWAFPYGDLQRANLEALIQELSPKTALKIGVVAFLTCKELYERILNDSKEQENPVDNMLNKVKRYDPLIKAGDMSMYLALVLADAEIDEKCEYPSVEAMRVRIDELEEMKTEQRIGLFNKKSKDRRN